MSLENTASKLDEEEFVDELKPGTKLMLGQYTIEGFLAAGGFGITYLAKDSLDRRVVIKECFPGSFCRRQNTSVTPRSRAHQSELKSIVRLFSQEAMSLAKTNHPNIVGVHQVFEENNTAYMALDYVHGRDLLEILEDSPEQLQPELVEGYLKKILDAIKHIHDLGMLHRDISPDNIIINEQGEPILIDFGAARESKNERVTRMLSALRVVKDGYSPQEFYIAGSEQGPSCDLYSLAASFYHIITRELPPDSQARLSACAAGDEDPYVPLGEKTDAYSKRFLTGIDKAMAVLPRDRMQNASEWLEHISGGVSAFAQSSEDASAAFSSEQQQRSSTLPILLGGTALVAAASAGYFYFSTGETNAPASAVAAEESVTAALDSPSVGTPGADAAEDVRPELPGFLANSGSENTEVEAANTEIAKPTTSDVGQSVPAFLAPQTEPSQEFAAAQNSSEEQVPIEVLFAEFAANDSVTFDIASLSEPSFEASANADIPGAIAGLSGPMSLQETGSVSLVSFEVAQPTIDTVPPEAPQPVVAAEVAAPQQQESNGEASSGVDFFVAMAKSQPNLTSSQTRSQAAAETAPRAPVPQSAEADVIPPIITRFVPVLPFNLSSWQAGVISTVDEGAPSWLTPSSRIVSVNGQAVSSNEEIVASLESLATDDGAGVIEVALGLDAGLNTAITERKLKLTTEKQTMLLNGLRFVSREDDAGWTTKVVDAPPASNFNVGDQLVSYVSTWEDLDGPNTLTTILERELANGTSSFSFAVSRDGEIWVEAFNLSSLAN